MSILVKRRESADTIWADSADTTYKIEIAKGGVLTIVPVPVGISLDYFIPAPVAAYAAGEWIEAKYFDE